MLYSLFRSQEVGARALVHLVLLTVKHGSALPVNCNKHKEKLMENARTGQTCSLSPLSSNSSYEPLA